MREPERDYGRLQDILQAANQNEPDSVFLSVSFSRNTDYVSLILSFRPL